MREVLWGKQFEGRKDGVGEGYLEKRMPPMSGTRVMRQDGNSRRQWGK